MRPSLGYSVSVSCPCSDDLSQHLTEDDSPYPEVRSAVANTDDTSIPCGTFRAWAMGMLQSFRTGSVYRSSVVPSIRYHMGNRRAWPEPILFFPIPFRHYQQQCRTASLLPNGPVVGESCAELEDIRHLNQSWPVHDQRTCFSDDYGDCRLSVCIRCAFVMFSRSHS